MRRLSLTAAAGSAASIRSKTVGVFKWTRRLDINNGLTLHEGQDLLVLLFGLALLHQVDLVLQDEDVLELHDLDSCQVLRCLGLRTRLVTRCQEKTKQQLSLRDTSYMWVGFSLWFGDASKPRLTN